MKEKPNEYLEMCRIKKGLYGSDSKIGNNGAFEINRGGRLYYVIASDQEGWDHVSISNETRTLSWETMCWIKDQFFNADEVVLQYHVPKKDYVNIHEHCLHLWRKQDEVVELPPRFMV